MEVVMMSEENQGWTYEKLKRNVSKLLCNFAIIKLFFLK